VGEGKEKYRLPAITARAWGSRVKGGEETNNSRAKGRGKTLSVYSILLSTIPRLTALGLEKKGKERRGDRQQVALNAGERKKRLV